MSGRDRTPPPSYAEVVKGERRPSEELEETIRRLEEMDNIRRGSRLEDDVFPELGEASVWVTSAAEGKEPEKEKGERRKNRKERRRTESRISESMIPGEGRLVIDLSSDEADISNLRNETDDTAKWVEEHSLLEMIGAEREEPEGMKEEQDVSANLLEAVSTADKKEEQGAEETPEGAAGRWRWSTGRSPRDSSTARRGGMKARSTSRGTRGGRIEKQVKTNDEKMNGSMIKAT